MQGVSFSYKDPEAVMADARTAALANAKVRAEQFAAAAGVELGGVLRIVESSVASPVMYRELAGGGADGRRRQGRRRAWLAGPRRRRQRRLRDELTSPTPEPPCRDRVYGPGMADRPPAWRQGFDAVERQLAPRLEAVVQSEQFAVAVGLAARVQRAVEGELARNTRRVLHRLNLPAGTDVSRILNELGQLRVQVRELSDELEEARPQLADAERAPAVRPAPVKRRARKAS